MVNELGYTHVTALEHEVSFGLGDVEITAVPGSPIGPTLTENGYIIKGLKSGKNIYYEPHGYHSDSLMDAAPIDVIITPLINLKLPLLGAVIKGQDAALQICKQLKPQVIVSTAAGGDIEYEGMITSVLKADGTVEKFSQLLAANNLATKAVDPQSGETIELALV